ncbi:MAG TPA: hypothetical protein VLX28_23060 [Thermoanaerobaculia bacterium]|nr:hypothetical protein [Thermoanaerobaculia bacterium]
MAETFDYEALPGGDLVRQGLADLQRGVESVPALLVLAGGPRLRRVAIEVPVVQPSDDLPEHRLYQLLAEAHGDAAHSRYNALMQRLVSFERAAECVR